VESLETILAAHRAYLLGWNTGGESKPELITYRSGVPHPPLNGVLRAAGLDPAEALAEAQDRLAGVPWVWWLGPDSDVRDGLFALGATRIGTLPIMAVDIDRATPVETPPRLTIGTAEDLEAFVRAYAAPWESRRAVEMAIERERVFDSGAAGDGTVIRLAGYLDGRVAGTSVLWLSHGMASIYFVSTRPELRRRGIGAAMTRAALDVAREHGARTAALGATEMGESVYHRLGFRTVGAFDLIVSET